MGLDRGWYVRPTLFADVSNDMRVAREEIFGPVLVVIPYGNEDEAIDIANDSDYGLAGSVFTADPDHALDVARRVRTGTFGVNKYWSFQSPEASYTRFPQIKRTPSLVGNLPHHRTGASRRCHCNAAQEVGT